MLKSILKKIIPKFIFKFYHWLLAWLGAFLYGFPSRKMIVIGVTGTKGKSTVVYLVAKILEEAGYKVGATSTIQFKIADKEWVNDTKQTMQGRFKLQKLLSQMVQAGCQYAVVETSSEGILQYRHLGIDYDVAVFTNLSPEHIEAHGGYEEYKQAKGELFESLNKRNKILNGKKMNKVSVVNLGDEQANYFLNFSTDDKYGFSLKYREPEIINKEHFIFAGDVRIIPSGIDFKVDDIHFKLNLLGEFNLYNALAAMTVGLSQGVSLSIVKNALEKIKGIPGRLEEIENNKGFKIFIDYAHEPKGLEEVYKTIKIFNPKKVISVLGSQGGGRDKAKRPVLGELAARYTDYVIITNEDPYDENPQKIIDDVFAGVVKEGKIENQNCFRILDRKEAIKKALSLVQPNDIIIITGKGSETVMAVASGKKIPWDDRKVVKEILK